MVDLESEATHVTTSSGLLKATIQTATRIGAATPSGALGDNNVTLMISRHYGFPVSPQGACATVFPFAAEGGFPYRADILEGLR